MYRIFYHKFSILSLKMQESSGQTHFKDLDGGVRILLSSFSFRTDISYNSIFGDINRASGQIINDLARALRCNFYDVMEEDLSH